MEEHLAIAKLETANIMSQCRIHAILIVLPPIAFLADAAVEEIEFARDTSVCMDETALVGDNDPTTAVLTVALAGLEHQPVRENRP